MQRNVQIVLSGRKPTYQKNSKKYLLFTIKTVKKLDSYRYFCMVTVCTKGNI